MFILLSRQDLRFQHCQWLHLQLLLSQLKRNNVRLINLPFIKWKLHNCCEHKSRCFPLVLQYNRWKSKVNRGRCSPNTNWGKRKGAAAVMTACARGASPLPSALQPRLGVKKRAKLLSDCCTVLELFSRFRKMQLIRETRSPGAGMRDHRATLRTTVRNLELPASWHEMGNRV